MLPGVTHAVDVFACAVELAVGGLVLGPLGVLLRWARTRRVSGWPYRQVNPTLRSAELRAAVRDQLVGVGRRRKEQSGGRGKWSHERSGLGGAERSDRATPRRIVYLGTGRIAQVFPRNGANLFLERECSDFGGYFEQMWNVHFPAGGRGSLDLTPRHHLVDVDFCLPDWLTARLRLAALAWRELRFLLWLLPFLVRSRASIVTATNPYLQGLNAAIASRLLGIPYAVIITRDYDWDWAVLGKQAFGSVYPKRWLERAVGRWVLRHADLVLADREYYRQFAVRNGAASTRAVATRVLADRAYAAAGDAFAHAVSLDDDTPARAASAGSLDPSTTTSATAGQAAHAVPQPTATHPRAGAASQGDEFVDAAAASTAPAPTPWATAGQGAQAASQFAVADASGNAASSSAELVDAVAASLAASNPTVSADFAQPVGDAVRTERVAGAPDAVLADQAAAAADAGHHLAAEDGPPVDRADARRESLPADRADARLEAPPAEQGRSAPRNTQTPASVRPRHGLPDGPLLTYVGRLDPDKFALDLVDCLARVQRQFPEVTLACAGTGTLEGRLRQRAAELGVADRLKLLGSLDLDDLPLLLASSQACVAPHMGYTLVEAGLTGVPVVTYDFDFHGEIVRDGETGYLVPMRDVAALADRVCRLLADPAAARAMGARLRAQLLRDHSLEAVVPLYRQAYDRVLGSAAA